MIKNTIRRSYLIAFINIDLACQIDTVQLKQTMTTLNVPTADIPHNNFYTEHQLDWWDLNSSLRLLIQADDLCMRYIKDVLRKRGLVNGGEGFRLSKNLRVLDVGCGGGLLTEPLARAGCNILGIDINSTAVEIAKEHATLDPCLKNLSYQWESIEDHCLKNVEMYDVVISNFVLHHAKNHEEFIKSCLKCLKPGGLLVLSGTSKTIESWFTIILLAQMIYRCIPADTFDWQKFINFGDVKQILENNNSGVEGARGIYYDVFSSNCRWYDSTNGMYIMHATKH